MILLDSHVLIWWANGDRLRLSATALASHPAVRLLPLDPADRFLVAQARELGIPVRSLW